MSPPDYGRGGRLAVGTPQANPTVEAEFAILTPRSLTVTTTRLRSPSPDPMVRLVDYLERLEQALEAYGTFTPDAFGFACTGSSYVVGREREAAVVGAAADRFGYPIDTAGTAIAWAMDRLGAKTIGIVAPYPDAIIQAGVAYWRSFGLTVAAVERVETRSADTRTIYELASRDATDGLGRLDMTGLDAVLLSGTGLPTLPAWAGGDIGVPLLTSNACLAARMLCRIGRDDLVDPATLEITGWRDRLAEAQA